MNSFFKKQKRYVTLLETLIALSLLTVLLVIIFSFFKEMTTLSTLAEVKQKEAFKSRYLESRLAFLFERVVNERSKLRDFYFYIDPNSSGISLHPSLIFTFNNEIRLDPKFSGDVIGRLYVDNDRNFCLATWPIRAENAANFMNKEVLIKNVEKLSFHLYSPPKYLESRNFVQTEIIDPNKPTPNTWYKDEWHMVYKQMPVIIRIDLEVKLEKDSLKSWVFAFVLPSSQSPIYYPLD